ncbi:MAG: hypothetical protein QUV05_12320, partial [Phycisphaerae bacterium]|nr:hypothetical protein [Phycisphaerae bacterium]
GTVTQKTGDDGCTTFTVKNPGDYKLAEVLQDGWTLISPATNNYDVTVKTGDILGPYTFENFKWATVKACKVDSDKKPLAGWELTLGTVTQKTGDDGCTTFTVKNPGKYTLTEVLQEGWTRISPTTDPEIDVKSGDILGPYTFENFKWATVKACKANYSNVPLSGWKINLAGPDPDSGYTGTDGCITFTVTKPGDYSLTEDLLPSWFVIEPVSGRYDFAVTGGADLGPYTFKNGYVGITINKQIATSATGPWSDNLDMILVGEDVYYQFVVRNTGNVPLSNVTVTDPTLGVICNVGTLAVGGIYTCGPYGPYDAAYNYNEESCNTATATGDFDPDPTTPTTKYTARDTDTACYTAMYWGFTPGFWKNHYRDPRNAWSLTDYATGDDVCDVFDMPSGELTNRLCGKSLLQALGFKGGKGVVLSLIHI